MAIQTIKLESSRGAALIENGASAITTGTNISLFSTTIASRSMGTNKVARFEIALHFTTPALSTTTLTLTLKFGTASITLSNGILIASSLTAKPIIITGRIANLNSTNGQYIWVKVDNSSAGINILSTLGSGSVVSDTTWAIDTTIDQTLQLLSTLGSITTGTSIQAMLVDLNLS